VSSFNNQDANGLGGIKASKVAKIYAKTQKMGKKTTF
jgi:hypothetical protein